MKIETKTTDAEGRVTLPRSFANATVVVEQVSDTELRLRKVGADKEDETRFGEESAAALSDPDRDRFLGLLDSPPAPNEALLRAAATRRMLRE